METETFKDMRKKELGDASSINVMEQEARITPFVRLWLTMIIKES